ncbi:monofunctional biosynthetic peptidoglycan transglycosylase [uncultured Thiohalocapsa sp.]|uniref:monofunctional biosynthetic peptidoglycan transglycosylase n=1 Tax=uncultured Thiohalocapsa sp. TaxID=768990 RepID=UPI0025DCD953|nr:monofunctional biosynthetic peptidoglycan transglycosylase [uncultured Thiohalocapsa sp.]
MSKTRRTKRRASRHRRPGMLIKAVGIVLGAGVLLSVLLVAPLRWVDPPTSAFMVRHWISATGSGAPRPRLFHEWVDADVIPPVMALAAVAAEDQRFPEHVGFDLVQLRQAWAEYRSGGRLRGASTISQQTAKNLFLWPGRDPLRKALEAWLTLVIEALWPKERILEVYLNIAQFGPSTFGVGAAAWRFFERPAAALTATQAASLAAVLPNPERYRAAAPTAYVERRSRWIRRQMRQLGGIAYLDGVWPLRASTPAQANASARGGRAPP